MEGRIFRSSEPPLMESDGGGANLAAAVQLLAGMSQRRRAAESTLLPPSNFYCNWDSRATIVPFFSSASYFPKIVDIEIVFFFLSTQ